MGKRFIGYFSVKRYVNRRQGRANSRGVIKSNTVSFTKGLTKPDKNACIKSEDKGKT